MELELELIANNLITNKLITTGHPETKASHSRSACVVTSHLWEEAERGYGAAGVLFFWLAYIRTCCLLLACGVRCDRLCLYARL